MQDMVLFHTSADHPLSDSSYFLVIDTCTVYMYIYRLNKSSQGQN